MVMVHGDDKGLVMPPMVSQVQVVIIPCGIGVKMSEEEKQKIYDCSLRIEGSLKEIGIRAKADNRDTYSPGWKFNQYEMKVRYLLLPLFVPSFLVDGEVNAAIGCSCSHSAAAICRTRPTSS